MTLGTEAATTRVALDGVTYPAELVAGGAAYEVFSDTPAPGFLRLSSPGRWPYHRFVRSEVSGGETLLQAPVRRGMSWEAVHRLSQSPPRDPVSAETVAAIRATATIRRGTRMVKPLTPHGVAATLKGRLPHGFCYREWDVAHLRTPAELAILSGETPGDVAYLLRWKAIDSDDYRVPVGAPVAGLAAMPPHDRIGAPVLGTGFTPSSTELIPEWVTADLADLPMPAGAAIVAYPDDGTEVVLYTYQPEQRGWLRFVGPQWRHLLAPVREISVEQEYVPLTRPATSTRLIGAYQGHEYDAVADPPDEFRLLAMTRAARYPVESLTRRLRRAVCRGAAGTVLSEEGAWSRFRLSHPDPANVAALGAQCQERGVYEVWTPTIELTDQSIVDVVYKL